ncbi:Hypothetical predicted protein [Cloeon dipterum]|uniref:Uncharacterized protein n=1 Tax=Cloeon dipterum TaxID=197152 RepID=A0A8S1E1Y0_9INSE|nr:Hypothetical predicted protein [Cloeon dipterum]
MDEKISMLPMMLLCQAFDFLKNGFRLGKELLMLLSRWIRPKPFGEKIVSFFCPAIQHLENAFTDDSKEKNAYLHIDKE